MIDHRHPTLFGACTCSPEEAQNVDLILRYRTAPAEQRPSFFAPGYRRHRPGLVHLPETTGEGASGMVEDQAFPDRHDIVVDVVASGERVTAIWRVTGTRAGRFLGVEPTGTDIDMWEVGAWRIVGGLITDSWYLADELGLARQIGLL
jgi:hypothetical protein